MKKQSERPLAVNKVGPFVPSADGLTGKCALMTEAQLAKLLHVSKRKLESDRHRGSGVPFVKFGRRVLYRITDVEAYLKSRIFVSTAQARREE